MYFRMQWWLYTTFMVTSTCKLTWQMIFLFIFNRSWTQRWFTCMGTFTCTRILYLQHSIWNGGHNEGKKVCEIEGKTKKDVNMWQKLCLVVHLKYYTCCCPLCVNIHVFDFSSQSTSLIWIKLGYNHHLKHVNFCLL